MKRREFLKQTAALLPAITSPGGVITPDESIDSQWYRRHRKFLPLSVSRVAYVEAGAGPTALFIHGYPLNGYQWRGAIERLSAHRRCLAPDLMGAGWTQTPQRQRISPAAQAEMLAMLLDKMDLDAVDLVANDSGGLVAQLFLAKYPQRVRSLLLTNCDVDENSPPPRFFLSSSWRRRAPWSIVSSLRNWRIRRWRVLRKAWAVWLIPIRSG